MPKKYFYYNNQNAQPIKRAKRFEPRPEETESTRRDVYQTAVRGNLHTRPKLNHHSIAPLCCSDSSRFPPASLAESDNNRSFSQSSVPPIPRLPSCNSFVTTVGATEGEIKHGTCRISPPLLSLSFAPDDSESLRHSPSFR